ncbi:hypothetical protein TNCV_3645221 [Trichonephila clavipes]|nr:hypothetical protein TNCV_3645221 [Trichonephila clavipes]
MSSGRTMTQINLGVQGGIQGGSHKCHYRFKEDRVSMEYNERVRRLSTLRNAENVVLVSECVRKFWQSDHWYLMHDNATTYRSQLVKEFLAKTRSNFLIDNLLTRYPPYSPDLTPCGFYLFPSIEKHLQGRHRGHYKWSPNL